MNPMNDCDWFGDEPTAKRGYYRASLTVAGPEQALATMLAQARIPQPPARKKNDNGNRVQIGHAEMFETGRNPGAVVLAFGGWDAHHLTDVAQLAAKHSAFRLTLLVERRGEARGGWFYEGGVLREHWRQQIVVDKRGNEIPQPRTYLVGLESAADRKKHEEAKAEYEVVRRMKHICWTGDVRFTIIISAGDLIAQVRGWIERHTVETVYDDEGKRKIGILQYAVDDDHFIYLHSVEYKGDEMVLRGSDGSDPIPFLSDISIEFPALTFHADNCIDYCCSCERDYVAKDGDVGLLREWILNRNPAAGPNDPEYIDVALLDVPTKKPESSPE